MRITATAGATFRHKVRNTTYTLLGFGKIQAGQWFDERGQPIDNSEVAIYRGLDDGQLWTRARHEFEDGRFAEVPESGIRDVSAMPAPETPIQLHGGQVQPAMFFYAIDDGHDMAAIAGEHGFDISFHDCFDSSGSDEAYDAAEAAYQREPEKVLAEWQPQSSEGWQFAGKWHSEEGPVACFLRKREIAP